MSPRAPRSSPRVALRTAFSGLAILYLGLLAFTTYFPLSHVESLTTTAEASGLEPAWVASVIRCESRFREDVVSVAGAIGLMQIMPSTGDWIAEQLGDEIPSEPRLFDPETNLAYGCWYLAHLETRYEERHVVLWAYNAGPSRAEAWQEGEGAPFPETAAYVERIKRFLPIYRFAIRFPWIYRIAPSLPL